jgi:PhnB protein
MQLSPYLSFKGQCEEAFAFYAQCLGAKVGELFRYGGSPMADQAPADWGNKIMHGSLTLDGQTVMGADMVPQQYEAPQGISLSLHPKSAAEGERLFKALAEGGRVTVPFAKTFWAAGFGMVVDRFGIPWMVNCEAS